MTAVSASNPYGALSLAVQVVNASETETLLAAGTVVVGFLDELNRGRLYNPWAWGYAPQTGDVAAKWLPSVGTVTAITNTDGVNGNQTGQAKITLIPGTADQVNVASVQTIVVDRNALVIIATGSF